MMPELMFASALCLPLAGTWLASRKASTSTAARGRHARETPAQASPAEVAEARAVTEGTEFSGNTIQLPCRECGRRAVPPVPVVDSPRIPTEVATLVEAGQGWQVVATCTRCDGPLISRVLRADEAAHALQIGVVHAVVKVDHFHP